MANHNVSIGSSSFYDGEIGTEYFTSINPSSLSITDGDTVTFTYTRGSGGSSYVIIRNFDSGEWNSTANATLYNGQSVTRTRTAVGSDTVTADFPSGNFSDRNVTITAVSSVDTTPDNFSLGSSVTNAEQSTVYQANTVTVAGLSNGTSITASVSNGVFTVNDTSYSNANSSNKSVENGDKVRVWATSNSGFSSVKTVSLTLNNVTRYWSITTASAPVNPQSGTLIPLGISSGAINMGTLRQFFGEPTYNSNTIAMTDLYRGGNLVPELTQNSSVPTSGTISLSNLYGSYTSLFVDKQPTSQFAFAGFGQTGTAEVVWNQSTSPTGEGDVDIGYRLLKSELEYRWVINIADTQGSISGLSRVIASGVTSYVSGSSHTTAWGDTMTLILQVDHGLSTGDINGSVYMQARKVWNGTTYTLTTSTALWGITVESAGE